MRADVARTLIRLVSCVASVNTELEELKRSQSMSSLWKLHADALVVLLDMASTATEEAAGVAKTAESSDAASAKAIRETVQKLRESLRSRGEGASPRGLASFYAHTKQNQEKRTGTFDRPSKPRAKS